MAEYYRDRRKFDKLPYQEKVDTLNSFIEKDFAHWHDIYQNGCNDPFWADGFNLELVRNHIIAWLIKLQELDRSDRQLTVFELMDDPVQANDSVESDPRLPPVVDRNYMANSRKIIGSHAGN